MRYRKKIVEVDAVRFDPNVHPWPEGVTEWRPRVPNGDENRLFRFNGSLIFKGQYIVSFSDARPREAWDAVEFEKCFEVVEEADAAVASA